MANPTSQRTLAIIKPDGVSRRLTGKIIEMIEQNDLSIVAMKMVRLTASQAGMFYAVHRGKPFFDDLLEFMSSGKIVVMALEGEDAIGRWRALMGATDPQKAAPGTIRNLFGTAVNRNVCHGSDAPETALSELAFFFNFGEIVE
jgi:nucleoside-diphosphate kinase